MNINIFNKNSKISCGTTCLGNLYKSISDNDANEILEKVWHLGYRYFDTAPFYGFGLSEKRLGNFLKTKDTTEYIISSKVGRVLYPDSSNHYYRKYYIDALPFRPEYDYSYDGIMKSFEDSINRLGLEKINILYMHNLGKLTHGDEYKKYLKIAMNSGYKALEQLKKNGLIDGFGLGVNEYEICEEILDYGDWDYFLLAGKYTLLDHVSINTFFPKCEKRGVKIVLGGVFNSGILATGATIDAKYDYIKADHRIINKVKKIETICKKYNISIYHAAIKFALLQRNISSVLIGSSNIEHYKLALSSQKINIPNNFWIDLIQNNIIDEKCIIQ